VIGHQQSFRRSPLDTSPFTGHHAASRSAWLAPPPAELAEVFDEFFPDVRPPRCMSKIGVDRPGLLVSIAMVAVTD
jgi:hypothetical protein